MQQPTQFDKILLVPVVNLLVPWLDRAAAAIGGRWKKFEESPNTIAWVRYGPIAVYVGLFLVIIPSHKALKLNFTSPLPATPVMSSGEMDQLSFNRIVSQLQYLREGKDVYLPFGFSSEFANYSQTKDLLNIDRGEAEMRMIAELRAMGNP